jgi:hypothetical protein
MNTTDLYHPVPRAKVDTVMLRHVGEAAANCVRRMGAPLSMENLEAFLDDRDCVRAPVHMVFAADGIEPGDFARAYFFFADGRRQCALHIVPVFQSHAEFLPVIVGRHC